jgi:fibronectin-binding autotransporter adhesin
MFNSIWRRFTQWRSRKTPIQRRPQRTLLRVEMLEDRVTPSLTASISTTGILTVTSSNASDSLTVTSVGFQLFTITDNSGFTFTGGSSTFSNTAAQPILAMVFNLNGGGANTSLDLAGTAAAPINLVGPTIINNGLGTPTSGTDLTISATGTNVDITATNLNLSRSAAGLSMTLAGVATTSFTDTNITGSAIINHTGAGNTNFNLNTSAANPTALNTWGSLAITNGIGADSQIITDTDFTGNVTINNGAGSGTGGVIYPNEGGPVASSPSDGGSQTWFYGINDHNLLTIGGNLTVTTTTGQTDTEINNYNVLGALTVNGGAGIAGQENGSIVAIDNDPVFPGGPSSAGIPVFGSINITAGSVLTGSGVNAGLNVFLGTGVGTGLGVAEPIPVNNTPPVFLAPDYPIIVTGNLSVSATGTGSVNMYLDDLTVGGAATLTTSATNNNGVNIVILGDQATTSFGSLSVNVLANATVNAASNNVYLQAQQGTMNVTGALKVNLGAGADTLALGSANSSVTVAGTFTLTAKPSNSKAVFISALEDTFGALNWALSGKGTETALFTDTNVTGAATINTSALTGAVGTSGVGASPTTTVTINTSTATFNTWGSLSITNGTGADINSITDTNFKGNVTITNGAGATGDSSQFGGSETIISAVHDQSLLSILGSLSITTTTGQSDTEVSDYNIRGNVTLGAGTGITNQTNANVIGLEDNQAFAGSGTPIIGGNVTITGSALASVASGYGLLVALGTNVNVNQNLIAYTQSYPLTIRGNLTITVAGSGSPDINLNDLTVATGSTTITLGTEVNSLVQVQGTNFVSVYNTLTISSQSTVSGGGNNIYSLQNTQGTLEFNSAVKVTVGFTGNILDLAADAGSPSGVTGAVLDLFGTGSFTAGAGSNVHYAGTFGTNLFYLTAPKFVHI